MSSSDESSLVNVTSGDLLASHAQTLVNTVNCVGIMGKGIALAFKRRYPEMFKDYVQRCDRGEVRLGEPYVFRADDHLIVNFPTKNHWRAVSRLEDIVAGLQHLERHYREWGITSIAVPPLGCGNGQLEWDVVGPTLYRYLSRLGIPVQLYAPHDIAVQPEQLTLDAAADPQPDDERARFVAPEWVSVVAILDRVQRQEYHWPVGRVFFMKVVYFATQAGVPTGLAYEAASYGPYAAEVKKMVARLQNNGLLVERQQGRMFEVRVGPTYRDAVETYRDQMEQWRPAIERTVDLVARMTAQDAEIAASVHYAAGVLLHRHGRRPTATEVVQAVAKWKVNRQPPLTRESIVRALVLLGLRGWLDVTMDDEFQPEVEKLIAVG
ncbi:type II toxin-antitoxin system antitoxin DNA ADP-ribosyl glycohydrolase DarG [Acrocarpospora catenulata]|uniref:type II toxin-antitoxin system antitoxin DNA ADP-ribosyl glycohydrolase DarG n=1 Tax=Acrocarpospora catenulata TaxID=2836182 RepID=UPI001BD9654B|nr:macro domain-containing protein [Acrocarpospora catenulata]